MKGPNKALTATGLSMLLAAVPAAALAAPDFASEVEEPREQLAETQDTLQDTIKIVEQMTADTDLMPVLQQAKGIFLVPNYGRAAVGVGAAGGEGVLVARTTDGWSGPMMYNMGSVSVGLQAGIEAGQIAMILMTDDAVQAFMQDNNFSLNADAGLTLIDWSARAQGSLGKGDIVLWSDTEGLFADLAINFEDIIWDDEENTAYYGKAVTPTMVAEEHAQPTVENALLVVLP